MSRGYSRVILVGNLGRDPEMRYTPKGTPVTNFSIAVNRRRPAGDGNYQDEVDWYRVSVFGRQAEIADQYLKRGMKVLVDGQLQIRMYTTQEGVERTSVEVNCDNFQMLTSREEMAAMEASDRDAGQGDQLGRNTEPSDQDNRNNSNDFDDDDEDLGDVPF